MQFPFEEVGDLPPAVAVVDGQIEQRRCSRKLVQLGRKLFPRCLYEPRGAVHEVLVEGEAVFAGHVTVDLAEAQSEGIVIRAHTLVRDRRLPKSCVPALLPTVGTLGEAALLLAEDLEGLEGGGEFSSMMTEDLRIYQADGETGCATSDQCKLCIVIISASHVTLFLRPLDLRRRISSQRTGCRPRSTAGAQLRLSRRAWWKR